MKLYYQIIFELLILLFSSGCYNVPIYGTAHKGTATTYHTKPVYRDSSEEHTYISGQICNSLENTYPNYVNNLSFYNKDKLYFGEVDIYRSITEKHSNLAYSFFSYAGNYNIQQIKKYQGDKYFIGAGLNVECNYNIPFEFVDWRIIGARATVIYENGDYATFRKKAHNEELIFNMSPFNIVSNFSFTDEIIVKYKDISFGYYIATGITIGDPFFILDGYMFTWSQCLHLTYDRFTLFSQLNSDTREHHYPIPDKTWSVGLTYKLK